jgi:hypothetical protein
VYSKRGYKKAKKRESRRIDSLVEDVVIFEEKASEPYPG